MLRSMKTLIISDLHLSPETPHTFTQLKVLLEFCKKNIQALYILGDLFEVWLGDDDTSPFNQSVIEALRHCSAEGTQLFLMRGNRDFLMGNLFSEAIGATLLPDPHCILLQGKKTLLTHGDQLCTQDKNYQKYRRCLQHPLTMKLLRGLPLSFRRKIGASLRAQSHQYQKDLPLSFMDIDRQELFNWFLKYDCDQIIHGHTHRPSIHYFREEKDSALWKNHYVLSDWHETGNALFFSEETSPRLINFDTALFV